WRRRKVGVDVRPRSATIARAPDVAGGVFGGIAGDRTEATQCNIDAIGVGRINDDASAVALGETWTAQVASRPAWAVCRPVGGGIDESVVLAHPNDVRITRGHRNRTD